MDFLVSCALFVTLEAACFPQTLDGQAIFLADATTLVAMPVRLSEAEVQQRLASLPEWTTDGETLFYDRTFPDFVAAIAFVNRLVDPAETLGHHPDITIRYNQVSLRLTTHDAQGLTELDFQLAEAISQL